jgi:hypothetical protein
MIRHCLLLFVVAALSVSLPGARSQTSPKAAKRAPDKVLPLKGTATVNSCAAYGAGFVKVEGTDTCVQIGGSISVGGTVTGRR